MTIHNIFEADWNINTWNRIPGEAIFLAEYKREEQRYANPENLGRR